MRRWFTMLLILTTGVNALYTLTILHASSLYESVKELDSNE
ncbi:MAG: hypothetical protein QXV82_10415 [Ignisphaera sp.]